MEIRKLVVRITGVAVVVALATAAYVWWRPDTLRVPTESSERITIAINPTYPGSSPVFIALVKGYFQQEGLQVTLQPYTSGKAALDAVLDKKADLATAGDIPLVFAVMKGAPVYLLASMSTATKDQGIVARKDKGISAPSDLTGKRIGVTPGTSGPFVLDSFLIRHGISPEKVSRVDLKPEETLPALVKGDVQAISIWQPILGTLQKEIGEKALMFYVDDIYQAPFTLVGLQAFIKQNPRTARRILRATIKAADFIRSNPKEARTITVDAAKVDPVLLGDLWPLYTFAVRLDQSLILTLEDQARWAIKNKLTEATRVPNFLDFIDTEDLRTVVPTAVTIIR